MQVTMQPGYGEGRGEGWSCSQAFPPSSFSLLAVKLDSWKHPENEAWGGVEIGQLQLNLIAIILRRRFVLIKMKWSQLHLHLKSRVAVKCLRLVKSVHYL